MHVPAWALAGLKRYEIAVTASDSPFQGRPRTRVMRRTSADLGTSYLRRSPKETSFNNVRPSLQSSETARIRFLAEGVAMLQKVCAALRSAAVAPEKSSNQRVNTSAKHSRVPEHNALRTML